MSGMCPMRLAMGLPAPHVYVLGVCQACRRRKPEAAPVVARPAPQTEGERDHE